MLEDLEHLRRMLWGIHNIRQHQGAIDAFVAHFGEMAVSKMQQVQPYCSDGEADLLKIAAARFCCNRAIAFDLMMIGEAAKSLSEPLRAETPQIPWKVIIGTRDRLAHKPWEVNQTVVDKILTNHLPKLEEEITSLKREIQD